MSSELRFRADLDAAVSRRDYTDWLATRGIFADWLTDEGRATEAERLLETSFPLEASSDWPAVTHSDFVNLSSHQREQLARATVRPLGLLTGTPGTGKTHTTAALAIHLCREYGPHHVGICAPTGKAAVRCRQALEHYCDRLHINHSLLPQPKTIHSLLRIARDGYDGHGWEFEFNAGNSLPYQWVIVDECSMCNTDLMASLLAACADSAHVLLVGDTGQLPPVGHGAPLRDMILAGVPCGSLSEIHRNAGAIVRACAAIKNEEPFAAAICDRYDHDAGDNFLHIEKRYSAEIAQTIVALLESMELTGSRFSPAADVQVVCAVNDKGELCRKKLNAVLRDVLNGKSVAEKGAPFRVSDRVICLQNGWYQLADSRIDKTYVANGEMGQVVESTPRQSLMQFGKELIEVRPHEIEEFELAYAVTVHKMQGSSSPVVIVPIDQSPGGSQVAGREWWYTALSRASELVITVGRREVMDTQARRPKLQRRKTFLAEQIELSMAEVI